jgi:hypothetical protein
VQKREYLGDPWPEPEIYDELAWNLPGLIKHKNIKDYRPKTVVPRKSRS